MTHQYIERRTGRVRDERLVADRAVSFIYNRLRERSGSVFRALTGAHASSLLGYLRFDSVLASRLPSARRRLEMWGADLDECLESPRRYTRTRDLFERKIRYWERRPLDPDPRAVAAPSDSRMLLGSFTETSLLFIKDKFFDFGELLGRDKTRWLEAFQGGDFAIFRLTPEKYHYNHSPVSGRVVDTYDLDGGYHSCNPQAVVRLVTPYSKNKRVVTIIDSDLRGGTGVGLVAMIEVAALMIGEIVQCYSDQEYQDPRPVTPGLFMRAGQPKSLFRPGSSTVVLLFQPGRVAFDQDLLANQRARGVNSRFCLGFSQPLVETEVAVRSRVGRAAERGERG